jgi:hypothetical protein
MEAKANRKKAHSRVSFNSDSASSQMVMDELDKFENASNESGSLSSDSSNQFLRIKCKNAALTAGSLTKSGSDIRLPSTRQM